ncbi:hypothetical protein JYG23_04450 [Sedimentibacter sp. zth1]|uniref:IS3 family transposase n=1 Tax=Sedimentibacter sp. zth1 TaxID=2816908 RepID=UPI001A919B24|nr:IS3 family transposase [Sedimentibacter sp. zth1]QSX06709.1 hypothetical protein JYG23_04450 [Sedimentibacter sp. zth1]
MKNKIRYPQDIINVTEEYIEYYTNFCPQKKLGGMTPISYRNAYNIVLKNILYYLNLNCTPLKGHSTIDKEPEKSPDTRWQLRIRFSVFIFSRVYNTFLPLSYGYTVMCVQGISKIFQAGLTRVTFIVIVVLVSLSTEYHAYKNN